MSCTRVAASDSAMGRDRYRLEDGAIGMHTVGGSQNSQFKTKYMYFTFTPTATGHKTKTARAYHAWSRSWARTVCAYNLQHQQHQHFHPVKRNSLLKEHQSELVCNPWHETWDEKSRFGSTQTPPRAKELQAEWGSVKSYIWTRHCCGCSTT